ncbi:hypothetical protein PtrSN002B_007558 [Pyrenophora tritici-repentis]|nr:hypothetical protein A1F94_008249 [Pyrenophora tritici-repentis]KAI1544360.1 hypothetical protein PtrSN002B_007558 [Pyrenophora tritici-repentis]PZD39137.1 hypothetical protein A1F97_06147 [Pyrenophora tritici-repentis]
MDSINQPTALATPATLVSQAEFFEVGLAGIPAQPEDSGRLDLEIQRLFELRGPDGFDGENASHLDRVLEVQHGVELQLQAMAPAFEEDS